MPLFQVEKIRECITRLDKKLRGLDDIKDLKVTRTAVSHSLSACCAPHFPTSRPCPPHCPGWDPPQASHSEDPDLWFGMGPSCLHVEQAAPRPSYDQAGWRPWP